MLSSLPGAFGTGDAAGTRSASIVETHVSAVVFLGDRAYKVKKPVRNAFLDYSTRAARESVCRREVELNRRLAPDVYLGVLDVVGPDGQTCDHVIAMRRMPDDRRLETLAREGRATPEMLAALARTMAAFHARAERGPHIDDAASPAAIRRLWVDNFAQMMAFTPSLLSPDTMGVIEGLALTYLDGRSQLFEERIRHGHIVDGHGDLLSADIFCLDDGPRILDCLEFDDGLRFGDVLLDVAFLAMDLERLGRPQLARTFLEAYRELTAETHPRSLEHHYVAYRALVRAKVSCLLAEGGDPTGPPAATSLLDLCARHLYQGQVRLVLVGGAPGTGKTTVADQVGARLGCTVVRSDEVRKEQAGLAPCTRATADFEAGIYAPAATDATYAELLQRAEVALSLGESVVLDATWSAALHRTTAHRVARDTHAELTELCCECPQHVAARRLSARLAANRDASDATEEVAARLRARFDPWPSVRTIDTGGSPEAAVAQAMRWLGAPALLPQPAG